MNKMRTLTFFVLLICLLAFFPCRSDSASQSDKFPVGAQLPQFTLAAPDSPEGQKYLGLKSSEPFTLPLIESKLVLIEFLGVL